MRKFTSLQVWQQNVLVAVWASPLLAFGILSTDVLPESFRFQTWPEAIRSICITLFVLWVIADGLICFWYLFLHSDDDTTA